LEFNLTHLFEAADALPETMPWRRLPSLGCGEDVDKARDTDVEVGAARAIRLLPRIGTNHSSTRKTRFFTGRRSNPCERLTFARFLFGLAALLLVLLVVAVRPAYAAVFTVTNTQDAAGGFAGSLRDAINAANAAGSDDTIVFTAAANGTIFLTGGELPAPVGTLTITGNGVTNTIIDGLLAFRMFTVPGGSNVTLSGVTFQRGVKVAGGGIDNLGTLAVSDSTFTANVARFGGGILNHSTLTVTNSTFSGNEAFGASGDGAGGGIANLFGATLTVSNSEFSGNSSNTGAGIYNEGAATVSDSTFSGNSASTGGGICNFAGTLNLNNDIFANSSSGGDCRRISGTVNAQYTLIEDGLGCVTGTNTANLTGDPALNADLTLSNLSRAINAGSNALIPSGITTDLAGNARIQFTTVDMGAYESAFSAAATATSTATSTVTSSSSPTATATATATNTATATASDTPAGTPSDTPTATATGTRTATPSATPTATSTNTQTATPSNTPTLTRTNTATATPTGTATATTTSTATATATVTPTSTHAPNGAGCDTPSDCLSGNCDDNICCADPSCPAGQSCNNPGHLGTCSSDPPAPAPALSRAGLLLGLSFLMAVAGIATVRRRRHI
jgi:hypothetical protein